MQGFALKDSSGNIIRIIDFIKGKTLADAVLKYGSYSEDYFISENERTEWIRDKNVSAGNILDKFRKAFIEAGVRDEDVNLSIVMKECTSIAECILGERERFVCGTVVIGRRGITKKEEFLFGSTSSKILHSARECAVWVIE
jgi:nucleotide-binding universal stress UspA family protein